MSGIIDEKSTPPASPSVATPLGAGGIRGKVTGVTRMSAKAGFIAIGGLALVVFAIFYGITANGSHANSNRAAAAEPTPQAISTDVPTIDNIPGAVSSSPPAVVSRAGDSRSNASHQQSGNLSPQQQQAAQAQNAPQLQNASQPQSAPQAQPAAGGGAPPGGAGNAQMQNAAAMAQAMMPQQPSAADIRSQQAAEAALVKRSQQQQVADVERSARQSSILIGGSATNASSATAPAPSNAGTQSSPYTVQEGSVIPATLITGLNSDLPGTVTAMVNHDVYDSQTGKYRLIPAGSKIVGRFESQIVQGQSRVMVAWNRILYPNGTSVNIGGAEGADAAGYAGFTGKVDKHTNILNTILSSVIGIGTAILTQPRVVVGSTVGGTVVMQPSIGQEAGVQAAQQAQQQFIQANNTNGQRPTIEVRPGYIFNIFVDHDLVLAAPYEN